MDGGPGLDFISGGNDEDTIHAQDDEADQVDCGHDVDTANVDAADTVINCENVIALPL